MTKLIHSSSKGLKNDNGEYRQGFLNHPLNMDNVLYFFRNDSKSFTAADSEWYSIDFIFSTDIIIRWYYENIKKRDISHDEILKICESNKI